MPHRRTIDILVNNAGILYSSRPDLTARPDESFLSTLQVNVCGAYFCTKRLLPLLVRSSDPRIVNVGSTSGILGPNVRSAYGVSKAALHALTIATANELRGKVAVNALSPGWVKTDMAPDGPGRPTVVGGGGAFDRHAARKCDRQALPRQAHSRVGVPLLGVGNAGPGPRGHRDYRGANSGLPSAGVTRTIYGKLGIL